ncbi:hydroxymethylbilane synthase [Haloimpatiens sp. FM7315]|uniref:hydroxymethylbilane synthase n=1 Tax=Haloimpatiens sp. FM7315 TaxID=3298609 RepID=UPI00370CD16C
MKVVVGSRGSKLALSQTSWVIDKLKEKNPEVEFQLKVIKTKGDRVQNLPLDKIGGKGIFVKEIEEELLKGKIDIAVHSMKDMPWQLPLGLCFSYIPKREDFRDVIVLKKGLNSLEDLPKGARIGTGSKRRKYQLLQYREDLNIVPIRGNIDTRIKKIEEEDLHGVILAAAGIKRLDLLKSLKNKVCYINEDIMLPAPSQGILAIEVRKEDRAVDEILKPIKDEETTIQAIAERAFLEAIDGSCHVPVGALCTLSKDNIKLKGLYGEEEGKFLIRNSIEGKKSEARDIGIKLAKAIKEEMKNYER